MVFITLVSTSHAHPHHALYPFNSNGIEACLPDLSHHSHSEDAQDGDYDDFHLGHYPVLIANFQISFNRDFKKTVYHQVEKQFFFNYHENLFRPPIS